MTRLEVQKTLLLQWAERVGLKSTQIDALGYDSRLNDSNLHATVGKILSCMLLILTDSARLRSHYGFSLDCPVLGNSQGAKTAHSSRKETFEVAYRHLRVEMGAAFDFDDEDIIATNRTIYTTKGTIHNGRQFARLLSEIKNFIQSLNELMPISGHQQLESFRGDAEKLTQDIRSLRQAQPSSPINNCERFEEGSLDSFSEIDIHDVQQVESTPQGARERLLSPPNEASRSDRLSIAQTYDSKLFRSAATGATEALAELCESGSISVTALDNSGRSLLG
jgi:Prion-inhibition and propagation